MKLKKAAALASVAAVAVGAAALITPAFAEPVSNSYVLVGSDTLQDSTNALVNGTSVTGSRVRITSNNATLGSFDAFGSAAIQTKSGGVYFARPSGSGPGVTALRASITGVDYTVTNNPTTGRNITGQVDIARSSGGPGTDQNSDGKLLYYPYARDAVAYAYKGGTAAWANITAAQLKQIYDGDITTFDGVAIKPRLPQTGSGTRNFFVNAIGYPGKTPTIPAVPDAGTTAENDGSVLKDGEIIPFSAASYIAQVNGATGVNTIANTGVLLGSPIAGTAAYTGSAPSLVPNSSYYSNTTFGRDTYLVVERARVTVGDAKYDKGLADLVDPSKSGSLTTFGSSLPSTPGAVKTRFGFLAPLGTTPIPAFATL